MTSSSPVRIVGKNVSLEPSRPKTRSASGSRNNPSKQNGFTSPIKNFFSASGKSSNPKKEQQPQNKRPLLNFRRRRKKDAGEGIGSRVKEFMKRPLNTFGISESRNRESSASSGSNSTFKQTPRKKKKKSKLNTTSKSSSEPALSASSSGKENRASTLSLASSNSGQKRKRSGKLWNKRKGNSVQPKDDSKKGSNSQASSRNSSRLDHVREPVFTLDVKTLNMRLVTERQRKEIYALNRIMTRLENEKFNKFLAEKGYRSGESKDYDIFM